VDFIIVIQPKHIDTSGGPECFASAAEPRKTSNSFKQLSSQVLFTGLDVHQQRLFSPSREAVLGIWEKLIVVS
jgi:hypothetical protein